MKLPRIAIAYGVSQDFPHLDIGDMFLRSADEYLRIASAQPLTRGARIIPLSSRLCWNERIRYEDHEKGRVPRIFNTEDEVLAAGGTTTWGSPEGPPPSFTQASDMLMLVRTGKRASKLFPEGTRFLYGSDYWTAARWMLDSTVFFSLLPVFDLCAKNDNFPVPTYEWDLWTCVYRDKYTKNHRTVPNARIARLMPNNKIHWAVEKRILLEKNTI